MHVTEHSTWSLEGSGVLSVLEFPPGALPVASRYVHGPSMSLEVSEDDWLSHGHTPAISSSWCDPSCRYSLPEGQQLLTDRQSHRHVHIAQQKFSGFHALPGARPLSAVPTSTLS